MSIVFTAEQLLTIGQRVADGDSATAIGQSFGCSQKTILRVDRENNLGPWISAGSVHNRRARPADFAQRAKEMPRSVLMQHYICGQSSLDRWLAELGIESAPSQRAKNFVVRPDDFAEIARGKTIDDVCSHYGFSRDTVRRMRSEIGLTGCTAWGTGKTTQKVLKSVPMRAVVRPMRNPGVAGQACEYLRKFGPIWRCNERGGPSIGGDYWRRGSAILTDAEIIERAEALGWVRDAWMQVRAA